MDEKELERRLSELKDTWRIPQDPPLDRMWQTIASEAFPDSAPDRRGRWTRTLLPLAAMLLLGFGIGQVSPALLEQSRPPTTPLTVAPVQEEAATPVRLTGETTPFVGVATDYLERVTALLVTLADAARRGGTPEYTTGQVRDLLSTTRLLLNSPQAGDPHLQELLNDLELVLAQIVRLPRGAAQPDVYLIDQSVDQREVLPRLREYLAENSTSQP